MMPTSTLPLPSMLRRRLVALAGALSVSLFAALPGTAAEPKLAPGHYRLAQVSSPQVELGMLILEVKEEDGRLSASLLRMNPRMQADETAPVAFKSVEISGSQVTLRFPMVQGDVEFTGTVRDDGTVAGVLADDRRLAPALLRPTEDLEPALAAWTARREMQPDYAAAMQLQNSLLLKRSQALRATDAAERRKLLEEAAEIQKRIDQEMPGLLQKVIEAAPDSYEAGAAALTLLENAAARELKPQDLAPLLAALDRSSVPFGRRWQSEVFLQGAERLHPQAGFAEPALGLAQRALELTGPDGAKSTQVRGLKNARVALKALGREAEFEPHLARLEKLEVDLDHEYEAKVPPFKPEPFAGRQGASQRVVLLELFTGAQCPPCVAADVACDALAMAYQPKDLVLLQYHLHIPGPDPLTNTDTEQRWSYYRARFPTDVRGTPTTVFNGKPQAGGGGGMAAAERKFAQYTEIINPLLETDPGARIVATAARSGETLSVSVEVAELQEPGENKKLHVVVAERTIRYQGSNGVRIHHNVVRDLPTGAGIALTEANSKHSVRVDLNQVRSEIEDYLEQFEARGRRFPYPDRPLDLASLRVIAVVQNEETGEVLQAVQIEPAAP